MKFDCNGTSLNIFIDTKIDSGNARETEAEIGTIIEKEKFEELYFDFSGVPYISSAGLRVFMSLAKKYKKMYIINVCNEVWDIFEMTGMSQIINIRRRLREISLDGASLIGDGFFSRVYRIDEETIVKQYIRDPKIEDVYRELNLAKQAFIQGIPTAISYDVVLADGKYGVVFEMINGGSMRDLLLKNYGIDDEKTKSIMAEHATLLKTINETQVLDPEVPSAKSRFLDNMEKSREHFNSAAFEKMNNLVRAIPEDRTYVHGDCHIKNILCNEQGDLQLIDMDTLSYGNPIFEFVGLNACYNGFEMFDPGNNERFLGVKKEIISELYEKILEIYFSGEGPEKIQEYKKRIDVITVCHMVLWLSQNMPDNTDMIEKYSTRLDEIIDSVSELALPV